MAASLRKLIARSRATSKVRNVDRRQDFRSATDSLEAIFGNLRTTQKGVSRTMTKANARTLANMERVLGRTQAGRGAADAAGAKAEDRYGSVLGSSIRQQLGEARSVGRSTATQAQGLRDQGAMTHRAGVEAMDLLQEGTAMARQSAKSGLAEALAIRASEDAALTAEARLAIAEKRLDLRATENETQGANGQYAQEAVTQLQTLAAEGGTKAQATTLVNSLGQQYQLGPKAKAALTSQLTTLYPTTGPGAMDTQSSLFVETGENGTPLQMTVDAADKEAIVTAVNNVVGSATMDQLTDTYILSQVGVAKNKDGIWMDPDGEQVSQARVAGIVAEFKRVWGLFADPEMRKALGLKQTYAAGESPNAPAEE
jgi:hypothetical protein